ncbi:MAG: flagellar export chaperone FlgN, partial [Halioglobus sp.]
QLNRENGRLILQKQQHTQSALNILRQNADQGPTYSGRGLADSSEDSRTLGKA